VGEDIGMETEAVGMEIEVDGDHEEASSKGMDVDLAVENAAGAEEEDMLIVSPPKRSLGDFLSFLFG
jgi:hypothetical protein